LDSLIVDLFAAALNREGDRVTEPSAKGCATINELEIYWESHGDGGTPVVVLHEGFGLITMSVELIDRL
jgi:hypothetical protein